MYSDRTEANEAFTNRLDVLLQTLPLIVHLDTNLKVLFTIQEPKQRQLKTLYFNLSVLLKLIIDFKCVELIN